MINDTTSQPTPPPGATVADLFREWWRLQLEVRKPGNSDEETDAINDEQGAIERRIATTPAATYPEIIAKVATAMNTLCNAKSVEADDPDDDTDTRLLWSAMRDAKAAGIITVPLRMISAMSRSPGEATGAPDDPFGDGEGFGTGEFRNLWGLPEINAQKAGQLIEGIREKTHGTHVVRLRRIGGRDFLSIYDCELEAFIGGNELIRREDVDAVRAMLAPESSDTSFANDNPARRAFDAVKHHPIVTAAAGVALAAVITAFQNGDAIKGFVAGMIGSGP